LWFGLLAKASTIAVSLAPYETTSTPIFSIMGTFVC
jgi:hypothetical protein